MYIYRERERGKLETSSLILRGRILIIPINSNVKRASRKKGVLYYVAPFATVPSLHARCVKKVCATSHAR